MDLIDNLFEIIGECAHLKRKIKSRISNSISTNSLTHSAGRCMRRASLRGYLFLHHSKAEEKLAFQSQNRHVYKMYKRPRLNL